MDIPLIPNLQVHSLPGPELGRPLQCSPTRLQDLPLHPPNRGPTIAIAR
jgi:hypothetical protein